MIHLDHLIIIIITIMIIVGLMMSIDMIAHISIISLEILIQHVLISHFVVCEKNFHTVNCEEGSLSLSPLCVSNYWGHDMPTHGVQQYHQGYPLWVFKNTGTGHECGALIWEIRGYTPLFSTCRSVG